MPPYPVLKLLISGLKSGSNQTWRIKMHDKQQTLFERVGGEQTISDLIHKFYDCVLADPELKPFFKNTSMDKLRRMQREFFSAALDGPTTYSGRPLIGVDMTPEMITKARKNADKTGTKNVEFRLGEIEHLPVADNSTDLIMQVYREAYRILKPGGRLSISDVLATANLPDEVQKNLALVAACVGGAATFEDTEKILKEVGFQKIKIKANDNSRDLIREWDPDKSENAVDYVVSAYIEAVKQT
jgi:hypothetical protein